MWKLFVDARLAPDFKTIADFRRDNGDKNFTERKLQTWMQQLENSLAGWAERHLSNHDVRAWQDAAQVLALGLPRMKRAMKIIGIGLLMQAMRG